MHVVPKILVLGDASLSPPPWDWERDWSHKVNIFTQHGILQHMTSTRSAILLNNRVGACIGRWRWRWNARPTPPHMLPCRILSFKVKQVRSFLRRSAYKNRPVVSRLSGSFKVIVTDTDRSATYDFLLAIFSNHELISYPYRDKRRFRSKIAK